MNVLMIVLEDFPGAENRVRRQALALKERGHTVRVMACSGPSTERTWRGIPITRTWVRRKKSGGMMRRVLEYSAYPAECLVRVVGGAFSERHDVVQVAGPPDWLVFAGQAARLRGARIVLDIHDPMPELFSAKGGGDGLANLLAVTERISCARAEQILVPTAPVERLVSSRNPKASVQLVPNCVDKSVFPMTEPRPATSPRVVFHGTIARRFGVMELIESVRLARSAGTPLRLDVFGDGDALPECRAHVAHHNMDECVTFFGQVSADALADRLIGAAVGAVPYLDSPFMRVAYSSKAFEYAALGVPMVMSALPSLAEQFSADAVRFASPGDTSEWADALAESVRDPVAALRRAEIAQRELARFDWDVWKVAYVSAVESAAGGTA